MMAEKIDVEKLIAEVERYPALYDPSHDKYRHPELKEGIWKQIAKDLKIPGKASTCKCKWTHVRDQFRKTLRKRKSAAGVSGTFLRKYKFEDNMQFLVPHLVDRDGLLPVSQDGEDEEDTTGEYYYEEAQETQEESNNFQQENSEDAKWRHEVFINDDQTGNNLPRPSYQGRSDSFVKPGFKRKMDNNQDCSTSDLLSIMWQENASDTNKKAKTSPHPVDAFLAGISPILKALNPVLLNKTRGKIFAVAQEAEMEQLAGEGWSVQNPTS